MAKQSTLKLFKDDNQMSNNTRDIEYKGLDKKPATTKLGDVAVRVVQPGSKDKLSETTGKKYKEREFAKGDINVLREFIEMFPEESHASIGRLCGYSGSSITTYLTTDVMPQVLEYALKYWMLQRNGYAGKGPDAVPDAKRKVLLVMYGEQVGIVDKLVKMSGLVKSLTFDLHEKCISITGSDEDLASFKDVVCPMFNVDCVLVEV